MSADPSDDPPSDGAVNRRAGARHLSCIPASLRRNRPGLALVRNISIHGALVFTQGKLVVGEQLHLSLHFSDEGPGVPVEATVVRVVPRPVEREIWRYEVGVEFAVALTEYADEVRELEEKQSRLGFTKI